MLCRTPVLRQGRPSESSVEQRGDPALASSTLVSPAVSNHIETHKLRTTVYAPSARPHALPLISRRIYRPTPSLRDGPKLSARLLPLRSNRPPDRRGVE